MKHTNKQLYIGIFLTSFLLLGVLLLRVFGFSATAIALGDTLSAPAFPHLFGTDHLGRDVMSRVGAGALSTLSIAFFTVLIGGSFGLLFGTIAGYFGGLFDEVVMTVSDIFTAFPSLLFALLVITFTGPGTIPLVWALGILFIPSFARVVRGEVRRVKHLDYVQRAKLMGASTRRILIFHVFPSTLPVFLSALTIGFNNAVLAEASMSFLGLGVLPPNVSLGRILAESQGYLQTAPWIAISTGLVISLFIFSFSMLADGLRKKGEL